MRLRVTQLRLEADAVISVELRSPTGDRLPDWSAGAHIPVTLPSGTVRQYSLCGSPGDPHSYTIAVLKVDDGRGGSREVHDRIRLGDVLEVGEPRNDFALVDAPRYLLLAGGIGITPILAMVEELRSRPQPPAVTLLYGGRSRTAMAFTDRLAGLDAVALHPQDEVGLPDLEGAFAESPAGTAVYCCGPPAMLSAVREIAARYPDLPLHIEQFTAATPAATAAAEDGAFEVELARTGVTVTVPADQSVLDAVLAVAPDTPFSCTSGFCGTCETKVLSGRVDHRDDLLSDDERRANASMMICVSRAERGAKLTLDL
ncbi:PDR/VanB family oxidoreductase [Mycolicibacterium parafortuitum]|uniref:Oxidoreductase [Rhodococcus jostii RHA1] n=1 Tax=Mycolicibacterium parafortuitum TaxID=39692 RepID=A0A375YKX5_MYCPF|nr:PDR/VanB family oxidoreductase [Mycolicibacterium parafortuitum]ORB27718.1 oxidoreductase [Mycolicibacterium parafortuitum]SRX81689.1 oxidoreductase [Rhodococcus jostii RHA1] [Mycolicibacterium parafortuitum]